jgi:hypothetical protein
MEPGHTAAISPSCLCADDQDLTDELLKWLLEGKLFQRTLAHVLATSFPVHKAFSTRSM